MRKAARTNPIRVAVLYLLLPIIVLGLALSLVDDKIIHPNQLRTSLGRAITGSVSFYGIRTSIKQRLYSSFVSPTDIPAKMVGSKRGDVYFLSHGGPPSVEQYHSGPYKAWRRFGEMIMAEPPKGIVVVSAHWENDQAGPSTDGVIVNSNESNPLIYDFYNFPKRLYDLKFSSKAEPEQQQKVIEALTQAGIPVARESRGLDHGVWIPFLAAFGDKSPLPIVQVSLPGSSDPHASVSLGSALSKLRDEGYAIVTTGQCVHNLRDLFSGKKMPYTRPFMDLLDTSMTSPDPIAATLSVLKTPIYKQAHPTDEHFFPFLVALGAIHSPSSKETAAADPAPDLDKREIIFNDVVDITGERSRDEGLGWGMWRWTQTA